MLRKRGVGVGRYRPHIRPGHDFLQVFVHTHALLKDSGRRKAKSHSAEAQVAIAHGSSGGEVEEDVLVCSHFEHLLGGKGDRVGNGPTLLLAFVDLAILKQNAQELAVLARDGDVVASPQEVIKAFALSSHRQRRRPTDPWQRAERKGLAHRLRNPSGGGVVPHQLVTEELTS